MKSTLADLCPGQTGTVRPPRSAAPLTERLRDLGFTDGTPVTCMLTAPLGDPTAYRVRGTVISLRRADALAVSVEIAPSPVPVRAGRFSGKKAARPAAEEEA